jgi:DNA-binding NtrC family response regulator
LSLPALAEPLTVEAGFTCRRFDNLPALLALRAPPHAVLLRAAPAVFAALPDLRARFPAAMVVTYTAEDRIGAGPDYLRRGADHFLEDPPLEELRALLARDWIATKMRDEQRKALFLSPAMKKVLADLPRLARTDAPIFITGETGTGKEVIANLVHESSARAAKPFLKINCASLPRELIESELFGSRKGSFTGSTQDRPGLFVEASGGTLLLDELAEMRIETQPTLLRVLQEQIVTPLGSSAPVKVDVRLIASTNYPPARAVAEGRLRADLFYRLAILEIALPPLRERAEDIVPLFHHFLAVEAARHNLPVPALSPDARSALLAYSWPGNIRDLQAVVIRSLLRHAGDPVLHTASLDFGSGLEAAAPNRDGVRRAELIRLLEIHRGSATNVGAVLGITRQMVHRDCRRLGIDLASYKQTKLSPAAS